MVLFYHRERRAIGQLVYWSHTWNIGSSLPKNAGNGLPEQCRKKETFCNYRESLWWPFGCKSNALINFNQADGPRSTSCVIVFFFFYTIFKFLLIANEIISPVSNSNLIINDWSAAIYISYRACTWPWGVVNMNSQKCTLRTPRFDCTNLDKVD